MVRRRYRRDRLNWSSIIRHICVRNILVVHHVDTFRKFPFVTFFFFGLMAKRETSEETRAHARRCAKMVLNLGAKTATQAPPHDRHVSSDCAVSLLLRQYNQYLIPHI